MSIDERLELICWCAFLVLVTSGLIGLIVAVWMAIYATVSHG